MPFNQAFVDEENSQSSNQDEHQSPQSSQESEEWEVLDEWNAPDDEDQMAKEEDNEENQRHDADDMDEELEVIDEWYNASEFFELGEPAIQKIKMFRTEGARYSLSFRNLDHCPNLHERLPEIFNNAIDMVLEHVSPNHLVGLEFNHPNLHNPILIPFKRRDEVSGEQILHTMERVQQSNKELNLQDPGASIRLVTVDPPTGTGNHKRKFIDLEKHMKMKQSFILIKNKDNLCLPRALVVAEAKARHMADPNNKTLFNRYKDILKGDTNRRKLQRNAAINLTKLAGLEEKDEGFGIPELQVFQQILADFQIKVFTKQQISDTLLFKGPPAKYIIHLFHYIDGSDGHFHVIGSVPGFLDTGYFCEKCNKGYTNKDKHRCAYRCPCCYEEACDNNSELILCPDCNRYFRGNQCFRNHKHSNQLGKTLLPSVCNWKKLCLECSKHIKGVEKISDHKCGYFYCRKCKEDVPIEDHLCYMQPIDVENDNEDPVTYVFFDFETTQEKLLEQNKIGYVHEHEPNLCIAHIVCDKCRNDQSDTCEKCSPNKRMFAGKKCHEEFCAFLFSLDSAIAIAHNARGFDGHFIMQYLYNQAITPQIITRGLEIMSLSVGEIKIIDSFSFLPMALSALPKAFDEPELEKGFFPHLFNIEQNWNYIGEWPDAYYYSPASMNQNKRDVFYNWYNQQIGKVR